MTAIHTPARLRRATPSDLDTIRDLILAVGLSRERGVITATLKGCTCWVAEVDGLPVGCIGLEHGPGASLLRSACVLPEARGQGLGQALTDAALAHARLCGDERVYLFSSGAGPFWQRLGFVAVDPATVSAALPGTPQVRGGECRGWIHAELAWGLDLHPAATFPLAHSPEVCP